MKKFSLAKLLTAVCATLAFVVVFAFTACNTGEPSGGGNGLSLNSYALTIDEGSTSPLLVTSNPSADVIWTSSDESKVTVEGSGNGNRMCTVKAVATGTATVTATAGESYATCTVTVIDAEVIKITKDGAEVTSNLAIAEKGDTLQLAASSSREHDVVWESSKPLVASVSANGLVTAEATGGTVVITAKCAQHSDVSTSVTVVIGDGVDTAYNIEFGTVVDSNNAKGVWKYWNTFSNVAYAVYDEGVIKLQTTGVTEDAWWYNVQLFYTATASDKDVAGNALASGKHYELTFDIKTSMAGDITVNGYVLHLNEGENHCVAYYDHGDTAFSLQLGVEGAGCNLTNATIEISDISWKLSEKINLVTPAFTIEDNVITINDSNPAGSVGSYTLNLYKDGKKAGGVIVTNGETINTSRIRYNDTYTAQIIANAANAHYVTAPESEVTENNTVVVNNEHSVYDLISGGAGAAVAEEGTWAYWTESWVIFEGVVTDDVANITFSNNSGNWYDTQLFYKVPGLEAGKTYTITLHFENVPKDGRISINGNAKPYNLTKGTCDITLEGITASNGATITITFGVNGENNKQDIQEATDLKISFDIVENSASAE